jgi:spermidine/putrescine-binding protein
MHFLRTLFLTLLSLLAFAAAATQPQKSVIITWPSDAPDHIIDAARDAIESAGGVITHEYKILR